MVLDGIGFSEDIAGVNDEALFTEVLSITRKLRKMGL